MNRAMKNLTIGFASAMAVTCATAISANAYYAGYGNGDPGNWDFFTEQRGAPTSHANHPGPTHAVVAGSTCGYYHHMALETGRPSWWHRYHVCEHG